MKVDKGLKEYLRGKDYVLLTITENGHRVTLDHKNHISIIWNGNNSIIHALKLIKYNNWHPILIRYK
ncbi:hypothetical protein LCGC14_2321750 [marine sediment metagenome]|uniref:Uncharacterized protein n=1 Tax=marine sediment metagenome TaxID=412755 RepID=A0A0F9CHP8_9ZZZZ